MDAKTMVDIRDKAWAACSGGDDAERDIAGLTAVVVHAKAEALNEAADAWLHGAWGNTPRKADRIADRMAATQFAGDWLRARALAVEQEVSETERRGK